MSELVQVLPTSATVRVEDTDGYTVQLVLVGAVGAVTYTTLSPPSALVVSGTGQVASTGTLEVGTYSIFGSAEDTSGNTGTWLFTLTVDPSIVSAVSVVPVTPAPPTGVEISVPFRIDPATGGVAVVQDYAAVLEQHLLTILMTNAFERVMLPTYGASLEAAVFGGTGTKSTVFLTKDIQNQLQSWEPAVQIQGVVVTPSALNSNVLLVSVSFSIIPSNDINTVSVSVGGAVTLGGSS